MAEHIAKLIRGKDKVVYDRQKATAEFGDVCVVVNARELHMTGRKKFYKMYRHHT
jgi:ribosomal protein L13